MARTENPEGLGTSAGDSIPGFGDRKIIRSGGAAEIHHRQRTLIFPRPSRELDLIGSFTRGCYPRLISDSPPGWNYFVGSTIRPMNRMLPLPFSRMRKMNGWSTMKLLARPIVLTNSIVTAAASVPDSFTSTDAL